MVGVWLQTTRYLPIPHLNSQRPSKKHWNLENRGNRTIQEVGLEVSLLCSMPDWDMEKNPKMWWTDTLKMLFYLTLPLIFLQNIG